MFNQFGTYHIVQRKYCQSIKNIRHSHIFLLETFPSTLLWIFLSFYLMFLIFLCSVLQITWSVSIRVSLGSSSLIFSVCNLSLADMIKSIALYTLYMLMTSFLDFWHWQCLPFPPSLPCVWHTHTHKCTLKISNCRSNRHIPLCSKQNSEFLPLPITYLLISSMFSIFVPGTTVSPFA